MSDAATMPYIGSSARYTVKCRKSGRAKREEEGSKCSVEPSKASRHSHKAIACKNEDGKAQRP